MQRAWSFALAATLGLAISGLLGKPAAAAGPECTYSLVGERVSGAGTAYVQEIAVGPGCVVILGPVVAISVSDAEALLLKPSGGATLTIGGPGGLGIESVTHLARAVHQIRGYYDNSVLATETTHRQEFTATGSVTNTNWMQTLLWWREGTGWVNTGGAQFIEDPGGDWYAFTRGYGSYDNTSFPCGCQPCNHTTWAGVQSYGDGSWYPWFTYSGNLCSGWMYSRTVSWQEY